MSQIGDFMVALTPCAVLPCAVLALLILCLNFGKFFADASASGAGVPSVGCGSKYVCHHPQKGMIQYSRDVSDKPRSRGVLDTRFRGYDARDWRTSPCIFLSCAFAPRGECWPARRQIRERETMSVQSISGKGHAAGVAAYDVVVVGAG